MNKILEALKSREWVDYLDIFSGKIFQMCPTCNQTKEKGHKQDCEYLARMNEAERLPKRLTVDQIVKVVACACQELGDKHRKNIAEAIDTAIYGVEEPDHE